MYKQLTLKSANMIKFDTIIICAMISIDIAIALSTVHLVIVANKKCCLFVGILTSLYNFRVNKINIELISAKSIIKDSTNDTRLNIIHHEMNYFQFAMF